MVDLESVSAGADRLIRACFNTEGKASDLLKVASWQNEELGPIMFRSFVAAVLELRDAVESYLGLLSPEAKRLFMRAMPGSVRLSPDLSQEPSAHEAILLFGEMFLDDIACAIRDDPRKGAWADITAESISANCCEILAIFGGNDWIDCFIEPLNEADSLRVIELDKALRDTIGRNPESAVPAWNRDTGKLTYRGEVIKTVRNVSQATRIVAILDAFQEENWPDRIDDPIPGGDPEKLKDAINKSLNRNLSAIRFRGDGTGEGIVWELGE